MFGGANAPGIDVQCPGGPGVCSVVPGLFILRTVINASREHREDDSDDQDEEQCLGVEGQSLLKLLPDFVSLLFL